MPVVVVVVVAVVVVVVVTWLWSSPPPFLVSFPLFLEKGFPCENLLLLGREPEERCYCQLAHQSVELDMY